MKILIDGDNCRCLNTIERIARQKNIPIDIFCDYSHQITSNYANVYMNDVGANYTDNIIYNKCTKDDIVITDDVGLAGLVLLKCNTVLLTNGKILNKHNIKSTLDFRGNMRNIRRKSKRYNLKKIGIKDKHYSFAKSLDILLQKGVN